MFCETDCPPLWPAPRSPGWVSVPVSRPLATAPVGEEPVAKSAMANRPSNFAPFGPLPVTATVFVFDCPGAAVAVLAVPTAPNRAIMATLSARVSILVSRGISYSFIDPSAGYPGVHRLDATHRRKEPTPRGHASHSRDRYFTLQCDFKHKPNE